MVARFSPIEWRITRPPMCDNYFADRMRRKRAQCDCQHDKNENADIEEDGECHTSQEIDMCGNCDSKDNIGTTNDSVNDGSSDGDDSDVDIPTHEHPTNTIKYKLDKRFQSTKDMARFLISDDTRQYSTDNAHSNGDNDSFDCNDTAIMLAHEDCNHDCCGAPYDRYTPISCIDDNNHMARTNDIDDTHNCDHQLRFNHNIHEQNSFDSHADTHICDYIDCDGFQEMELLCSENDFTLTNSFWFSIGTLMQQGSDLNPKVFAQHFFSFSFPRPFHYSL